MSTKERLYKEIKSIRDSVDVFESFSLKLQEEAIYLQRKIEKCFDMLDSLEDNEQEVK